jgi:toxin ParE1/3/4
MTFDFHPDAETEFLEAIAYYESSSPGLGEDFSLEVYSTVHNILSYSHTWPIVEDDVRRCLTSRFDRRRKLRDEMCRFSSVILGREVVSFPS